MRKLFAFLATAAGLLFIAWAILVGVQAPERLPGWLQRRPSIYLKIALAHIRNTAMSTAPVDWSAVSARAKELARDAKTPADTYPAIRYALEQLGPGYGALMPPPQVSESTGAYGLQVVFPELVVATVFPSSTAEAAGIKPGDVVELVDGRTPTASADPRTRGQFVEIPKPRVALRLRGADQTSRDITLTVGTWQPLPAVTGKAGDQIGYVGVPGTTTEAEFAPRLRDAIYQTDGPSICGWIVDLRRNNGGGLWPVLQALRPILGEGALGSIVARGGAKSPWEYPTTGTSADQAPQPLARPGSAVAVLTSRLTANAGEAATIAFRGRPLTRVFGEPTWGAPATRITVPLVDGASLELTTALIADRTGHVYEGRVPPDEVIAVDWGKLNAPGDPTITAAGAWLTTQPGCVK
jgi:C-terminal processing protease CtpA/Prc